MERLRGWTGSEVVSSLRQKTIVDKFCPEQRDVVYRAYATMILNFGFAQIDAHPGNLMVLDDGRVALLDFGQCVTLDERSRSLLAEFAKAAPISDEEVDDD